MKMKVILLLTIHCALFQKGKAQWSAGTEQYYNTVEEQPACIVQVGWYQNRKWYAEIRHNYEALNSLSVYVGRCYERKAAFSYFVCPMAAIVCGNFRGGSIGSTIDLSYKKMSCSIQGQYTFSVADRSENFLYSWSELGYQACREINAGVLIQQTKPFYLDNQVKEGFYMKYRSGNWTFPLYIFDLTSHTRSIVLGINLQKDADRKQGKDIRF